MFVWDFKEGGKENKLFKHLMSNFLLYLLFYYIYYIYEFIQE